MFLYKYVLYVFMSAYVLCMRVYNFLIQTFVLFVRRKPIQLYNNHIKIYKPYKQQVNNYQITGTHGNRPLEGTYGWGSDTDFMFPIRWLHTRNLVLVANGM